ncbi:MAG: DUF2924 domain-containing protein [Terricaulis sp.]
MIVETLTLRQMSLHQLRHHWAHHCRGDLPQHSSRDLLLRAIVYQQEAATSAVAVRKAGRRLDTASVASGPALPRLSTGTVLVREWNDVPYAVTVTDDGFLWDGRRYASLSAVASAITGVHWNGPRFFKLDEVTREKSS